MRPEQKRKVLCDKNDNIVTVTDIIKTPNKIFKI